MAADGQDPRFAPVVARELCNDDALDRRLVRIESIIEAESGEAKAEAVLEYALLAAMAGQAGDAEEALRSARDAGIEAVTRHVDLAAAWVVLKGGDRARAMAALQRWTDQEAGKAPCDVAFAGLLRAQVLALEGEQAVAKATIDRVLDTELDAPLTTYARVVAADVALKMGDEASARMHLGAVDESEHRSGLLACFADLLQARIVLEGENPDASVARNILSQAVWQLVRLGAPRELGLCYLTMARVEALDGESADAPAAWLARAQPLLAGAGAPDDQEKLRRAFRAFGRRALDRLVDADLGTRIDAVRARRERLRDIVEAQRDLRDATPIEYGRGRLDDRAVQEALAAVRDAEEELVAALEGILVDRERIGQLVGVSQKVARIDTLEEIHEAVPRLALQLCSADAAELVEREPDGELTSVARHGAPLTASRQRLEQECHDVLDTGVARLFDRSVGSNRPPPPDADPTRGARVAVIPLTYAQKEGALVVARVSGTGGQLTERDLERLTVYGNLVAASIERSRGAEALREAAARDAATLEAIRDGVISLGGDGVLRAMNEAAGRLLRTTRSEAIGKRLSDLSGLSPLAEALAGRKALDGEVVSLSHGEVLVRSRAYTGGGSVATLQELSSAQRLAQRLVGGAARFGFDDLVGQNEAFLQSIDDARRAAASDVPILVTGESGTGKEMLAQAIHNSSPRAAEPFVGINVAAIPRELLESELFGYERGAFTGARSGGKAGKFELAGDGTILLDEIGEMSAEMQAKLLRVLQERVVHRLGGTKEVPIRARVVATTHRDLEKLVNEGTFRLDLFYRLRVVHLKLPPLRRRRGDVRLLVDHYLTRYCERMGRDRVEVAPAVMEHLESYEWPGNVRELANLIEGEASLLPADKKVIDRVPAPLTRERLHRDTAEPPGPTAVLPDPGEEVLPLQEIERRVFRHALDRHNGNVAQAARALGVARGTFYNKMKRYGIEGN